jgi:hypothetical protein
VAVWARWVPIVAGVAGAVVSAAVLLREVVLAFNNDVVWQYPSWFTWLSSRPGSARVTAAAVGAAVAALVCLWAAARLVRRGAPPLRRLDLSEEKEAVQVEAATLARFLGKALRRRVPELDSAKVWLRRGEQDGYSCRVMVGLRACADVSELHARLIATVREELQRATGLSVVRLDLDVEKLNVPTQGGS